MNWKEMPLSHKIATILSCLAVAVWLILNVKSDLLPFDLTFPAIAVVTVCEAVIYRKKKPKWACLLLVGAAISVACFLLELTL